jgi:hypothetical protein
MPSVRIVSDNRPDPRRPGLDPGQGFSSVTKVKKKPRPASSAGRRLHFRNETNFNSVPQA